MLFPQAVWSKNVSNAGSQTPFYMFRLSQWWCHFRILTQRMIFEMTTWQMSHMIWLTPWPIGNNRVYRWLLLLNNYHPLPPIHPLWPARTGSGPIPWPLSLLERHSLCFVTNVINLSGNWDATWSPQLPNGNPTQ